MRTYVPVPAQIEAVDPHDAFRKAVHMHEAFAFVRLEPAAEEKRIFVAAAVLHARYIVERQRGDSESGEILVYEPHAGYALAVFEMRAVIHVTHRLHKQREILLAFERRYYRGGLAVQSRDHILFAVIEYLMQLSVKEQISPVAQIVYGHERTLVHAFDVDRIQDQSRILSVILHRLRQRAFVYGTEHVEVVPKARLIGKRYLSRRNEFRARRQRRRGLPLCGKQHIADGVIVGRIIAPLGKKRAVVVTRDRRLIIHAVIRARGKAEIGPSVEHIYVEIDVVVEHRPDLFDELPVLLMMYAAPMIEPSAPEFHAHFRSFFSEPVERSERVRRARTEIQSLVDARQSSAREHPSGRSVGRKSQHVYPALVQNISYGAQIVFVVGITAVLVLDLHGDDVAAFSARQAAAQSRKKLFEIIAYVSQINGIVAAYTHRSVFEQPCRQSAEIPFRTDIRSRAQYHVQSELRGGIDEAFDVEHPRKIELSLARFVQIPARIGLHRIEPRGFELFEPVAPVFGQSAEVVYRTRPYLVFFPVPEKFSVLDGKHRHLLAVVYYLIYLNILLGNRQR